MSDDDVVADEDLQTIHVEPLIPHEATITLVDYDWGWPALFERESVRIREVLGDRVLLLEHAGSTSVSGLVAKPVIDIILAVRDSADEAGYVPSLTGVGYRLVIREPKWFEHRMFKGPDTDINLHTFSVGAAEIDRMLRFRNRLRVDAEDRDLYARTKRTLAARQWRHVQHYADAKADVVREIVDRAGG